MSTKQCGFLALLVAAAFAAPAAATTVVAMSDAALIRHAESIVAGKCVGVRSAWVDGDLVTLATIRVDEVFAGEVGKSLTVVIPGGIDMNRPIPVATTWPGAPVIQPQEEVLLFLTPEKRVADGWAVEGFSQGKYTIATARDGQRVATRNIGGLKRVGSDSTGGDAIPLRQLRDRVRALRAEGGN